MDEFYNFDLCNIQDSNQSNNIKRFSGIFIHLAAARSDRQSLEEYKKNNIEATAKILELLDPNKIKIIVHISSVAAIDGRILEAKDSTLFNSDDWYRYTKFIQEKIIKNWSELHNVKLLILAPSAIYTPQSRNDTNIGRLQKLSKFLPIIPSINIKKSLTNMEIFLKEITDHIEEKQTIGNKPKMRIVIDKPVLTVSSHMEGIKGKKFMKLYIPFLKEFLMSLAYIIEILRLENFIPLTKNRVIKLFKDTSYSEQRIYLD